MTSGQEILFRAGGDLSGFLQQREQQVRAEIDQLNSDYVLKVSLDDVVAYLTDKYRLEPLALRRDQTDVADSGDTKMDVRESPNYFVFDRRQPCLAPATFVELVVPFTGDAALFHLRPSTFNTDPPRARVANRELRFRYMRTDHDHAALRAEFERDVKNVEQYITWGAEQVRLFNEILPQKIRQRLEHRKEKFLKDRGLVEALGFPIRPRDGASATYAAPVVRKKLPIQRPTVPAGPFKPEPVLEMQHYEHILDVISNMVLVMERSPESFARLDEEALRTHILVQLNGHYEGQATGETFNAEGKTDILIRVEGRNIFIAECKFWKGAESFKKSIHQLLGYVAWRDTKTAIIVFNRNRDTAAVLKQIPELVKAHSNFKREITSFKHDSGFRFVLHQRDDRNRELTLTVLVFDVPS